MSLTNLAPEQSGYYLRIADQNDAEALNELRRKAYRNANGHKMSDESVLDWNETDEQSAIILVANAEDQLVSSVRTLPLFDQHAMEQKFDIRLQEQVPLPTVAVDRACTDPAYRMLGFTGVNRLILIEACRRIGFASISLTMNDSASRLGFLKAAGYMVEEADLSHRSTDSEYVNSGGVMYCQLNASNFDHAIEYSKDQLGDSLDLFGPELLHNDDLVDALCGKWAATAIINQ